ncbi:hypothetical protein AVEN_10459-1 [Araneus ventricosus]|uniref:Uncharacterized protein n=1 Tax=Araneus ventricosus TaxID=182803 RepID=A0A4Y2N2R9_ARAVE|nr:hypothetical protein AVEN_10459-1 [Araneus ventricosus]
MPRRDCWVPKLAGKSLGIRIADFPGSKPYSSEDHSGMRVCYYVKSGIEDGVTETKTEKVMDLTDLKDPLQAPREVKMLLQEFPTLLEADRHCREAQTKQEKRS